jgi:hypothetical protein
MRIEELAAQAKVNVETLRYYQRRGLLARIDGRIRDLTTMRRGLSHHIAACHRHHPLDTCPLLAEIGGSEASE